MGVTLEPSPVSPEEGEPTCAKRLGRGGGLGGDLGVGKARPGPRSHRALPEHPAEVAVPRVGPWRGRGRWPVRLAFFGGEGRLGSRLLQASSHFCMRWYGMVWYGMVWYGMVWYGMVW